MKKTLLLLQLIALSVTAQLNPTSIFNQAYSSYPNVPRGVLEAVSHSQTRMTNIDETNPESCFGLPKAWGFMGLIADEQNYFISNVDKVALLSGTNPEQVKHDPTAQIIGYAAAFNSIGLQQSSGDISYLQTAEGIRNILLELTFIPDSGLVNEFARNSELMEVFRFLNNPNYQQQYAFPHYNFHLRALFGNDNYEVLTGTKVLLTQQGVESSSGVQFAPQMNTKSTEYGPAIFNPSASCNVGSRSGTAISAITIHTIQGTYAGAISWSQNCSSNVSYHYVVRSSDGQVTQQVLEGDKAFHVGSENSYTIGYEHDGYVDNPVWYTEALYQASAGISRDIITSGYGIPGLRTYYGASSSTTQTLGNCTKIKGHQHYPSQSHTDPGINWNWEKYYRLINNTPTITPLSTATGSFYDSGGAAGSYDDDERFIWVIEPVGAANVSITFSQFSVENNYDYMFIYDGNSINASLIGVYTSTNSPGTINSSSGALTIEFRTDCATTGIGWAANWTSTTLDNNDPTTLVQPQANWQTESFDVQFMDSDIGTGVARQYARVSDRATSTDDWHSNAALGYVEENFDQNATAWTELTGDWQLNTQTYEMNDVSQTNSNASMPVTQDSLTRYLYHWKQTITTAGANQRAGMHFFCDNTTLTNRGNSYFVYLREETDKAEIYEVTADVFTLQVVQNFVVEENTTYDCKTTYDPISGFIQFFVNDSLAAEWQDSNPLKMGNGISLRSGGCGVRFDEIGVYKSRFNILPVSVGLDSLMRYESLGAIPSGKVSSVIIDFIGNWSAVANETFLIDQTSPILDVLNDGIFGADVDTIYDPVVSGNWAFDDIHSGIAEYAYAIGTSASTQDILPWTNAGMVQSINHVLASPVLGQTYYVHVRATNDAGLNFETVSDGQILLEEPPSTAGINTLEDNLVFIYPQPANESVSVVVKTVGNYRLFDATGRLVKNDSLKAGINSLDISALASGTYRLIVSTEVGETSKLLMIQKD